MSRQGEKHSKQTEVSILQIKINMFYLLELQRLELLLILKLNLSETYTIGTY